MPHQCLSCGFVFEEGSSALLQGCPQCKGTRFFYTADPVDEEKREQIAAKAQKDLRSVITEMLQNEAPEAMADLQDRAGEDGWARLRPRDLRRIMKEVQTRGQTVPDSTSPAPTDLAVAEARRRVEEELAIAAEEAKPDTVTIHEPGDYAIDVKGLLEKNPIVVQRDGAYMIHLPSLFGKHA